MKTKSGIYKILCKKNKKIYIRSAVNLHGRWCTHLWRLKKNIHLNLHLQFAFNKYGEKAFKFEVLEECERENLIEREQHHIDTLKPQFNIRKEARSNLGLSLSEEGKQKLREFWTGKKRPRTKEHTENLRKTLKGKLKGRTISEEHKQSLREQRKGSGNPMFGKPSPKAIAIEKVNNKGEVVDKFTSVKQVIEHLNSHFAKVKLLIEKEEVCDGFIYRRAA